MRGRKKTIPSPGDQGRTVRLCHFSSIKGCAEPGDRECRTPWSESARANATNINYVCAPGKQTAWDNNDVNAGPEILQEIISSRHFPNDVFTGSAAAMQPIVQMVGRQF